MEQQVKVEAIAQGEYVKRKADSQKVYIRKDYNRCDKTYTLQDTDDMSRFIYVRKGTILFVGFTY